MPNTTITIGLLEAEEATRILTVTALTVLWLDEKTDAEKNVATLRAGVEALSDCANCPDFLTVFDEAVRAENEWLETAPGPNTDEVEDNVRRRQAWRAEKYLTALAEQADTPENFSKAALFLRGFWATDDPITEWMNVRSLMKA